MKCAHGNFRHRMFPLQAATGKTHGKFSCTCRDQDLSFIHISKYMKETKMNK